MLPDPDSFDWILFDCFNTLILDRDDSGDQYGFCGTWSAAVAMGLASSVAELTDRYRTWRQARHRAADTAREADLDERLRAVLGTAADATEVRIRLHEAWRRGFAMQTGPIAGVPAMLAHWSARKRLGVVSNFYVAGHPRCLLDGCCLLPYLTFVLDSAELGIRKPDPRIYAEALRQTGIDDPRRVLFVGDSWINDVVGPGTAGMQVMWFDRGLVPRPEGAETVTSLKSWDAFR